MPDAVYANATCSYSFISPAPGTLPGCAKLRALIEPGILSCTNFGRPPC